MNVNLPLASDQEPASSGLKRGLSNMSLTAYVIGSLPPRRISRDTILDRIQD
ncbi:hypothetical protein PENANT_c023G09859 [Penicillium antarcticum]|uniref:Uncharacterized protein n=1 Tax=Penicillium antarcticum TaxID=416450 RepID=A0A1V6Q0H1_9EURO|nr:hypothetical protein PENANT_c023G09859 [Penicillium antarcticum]